MQRLGGNSKGIGSPRFEPVPAPAPAPETKTNPVGGLRPEPVSGRLCPAVTTVQCRSSLVQIALFTARYTCLVRAWERMLGAWIKVVGREWTQLVSGVRSPNQPRPEYATWVKKATGACSKLNFCISSETSEQSFNGALTALPVDEMCKPLRDLPHRTKQLQKCN